MPSAAICWIKTAHGWPRIVGSSRRGTRLRPKPIRASKMVAATRCMRQVLELAHRFALGCSPILILGESGTGKELVAREIHEQSAMRKGPFVVVDCPALAPSLAESELFGHVKGAFTGADDCRRGLLASAGSGIVFLDEIGELPLDLQVKLFRVLQEHEIRPVGSDSPIQFKARVIAATNRDLEAAVKEGSFRGELYYRLNVLAMTIPSLRERRADIPLIAHYFIGRYGPKEHPLVSGISYEALHRLIHYNWPGNVRELENAIQCAIAIASSTTIEMKDLPRQIVDAGSSAKADDATFAWDRETRTIAELEEQAIRQALMAAGGNCRQAARLLGIGKTTMYRKMKKYGTTLVGTLLSSDS